MKAPSRAYTDLDIAECVLGLTPPEDTAAIQAWLAQDDAAAACALKWEAYLLDIADELPGLPPAPELQARIQASLGFAAASDDAPVIFEGRTVAATRARHKRPTRLRRGRVAAVAAVLATLALATVIGMALLRPAPQKATERTLQLTPVNPALPIPSQPAR
ncbi:hypothetical protein [Castellaniella sp. GW247-6E4]|uniref:hypothetical protein n=1 Tax=Castellaniella sp. GW247-6E4 TaxID=3140380 RepID=UPI003315DC7C